eukprot:TRINITY_DN59160_c0_g1_i1.p2 TRINITY_DN59160_c0_g1~~TRINITY_DN59160_c0_g1_i1.p2  ORF type:complete len:209 (-),score=58.61 TRINITY_DN59160_c0_g1_i1:541-1110(-)
MYDTKRKKEKEMEKIQLEEIRKELEREKSTRMQKLEGYRSEVQRHMQEVEAQRSMAKEMHKYENEDYQRGMNDRVKRELAQKEVLREAQKRSQDTMQFRQCKFMEHEDEAEKKKSMLRTKWEQQLDNNYFAKMKDEESRFLQFRDRIKKQTADTLRIQIDEKEKVRLEQKQGATRDRSPLLEKKYRNYI